jgi:ethanolamine ammonia-lyase small subunit
MDQKTIDQIADWIAAKMKSAAGIRDEPAINQRGQTDAEKAESVFEDIDSPECKAVPGLKNPKDPEALLRMMRSTTARIGVGKTGPRLLTRTLLTLRADHAKARDAVFADVDPNMLKKLNLFTIQTQCENKDVFITRPDLGRKLSDSAVDTLRKNCVKGADVQIYAADGLSSTAIEANLPRILPVVRDALEEKGISVGTPFFLKYGRVASEDQISEILAPKVVCVFIGERPGLATAESMSAYIAYNAYVGMPEAKRTVVSNIHRHGTAAVEAGAYIADVIELILDQKTSGIDLKKS